jgi:phosphoesterase RecJ-like protein
MLENTINFNLEDLQKVSGKIMITTHLKPDGDAMGSSLGLYYTLKNLNVDCTVVSPTDYAEFLQWMPGSEDVLIYDSPSRAKIDQLIQESIYIFCLDFNNLSRLDQMTEKVRQSSAKLIMIDHHTESENFDHHRFYSPAASSTCELIFQFIENQYDKKSIDKNVAQCLYTGIITDTGSFKYSNTSQETLRIASELMKHGAVPQVIYENIFDQNEFVRLQLLGFFLSQRIEIIEDGKVALSYLTAEDLENYHVKTGDTEGLVNYGLCVKGVELSVLFVDRKKIRKVSFRSRKQFPCNEFSKAYFNGGGHYNAAGGASYDSLEKCLEKFKKEIANYKNRL